MTGLLTGMKIAIFEIVSVGKDLVRFFRVRHVFLDSEVWNGEIEVERRSHGHRRKIGGAVAAGLDVIHIREGCDLFERRDPTAMNHADTEIINELFGDQSVGVPNSVEDLADRQRRGRVLADDAEACLKLGGNRVFEPEEVKGLEAGPDLDRNR